ncbi:TetR/AcrR family transcriptional regulator [Thermoleophilia bacterium SCSIO 60948]|nr:TetR/AcrR family transcriptional regulator [Thermoleophilia bacterium SCSIO 60948]
MRDRAILDAAKRLFYERGFDAVGVDEIGTRAGVTGPAIYRHFSGKEEILSTLFDEAMDHLLVLAGGPTDDPFHDLHTLVTAQTEFALRDRELLSIYAREDRSLSGAARKRLARRQRQHVDRWVDVLRRCYPERSADELTTTAYALIGMLISVAHWPKEAMRTAGLAALLTDLAERGLGALAGTRAVRPADRVASAGPD